jgi:hypothetical protein
MRSNKNTRCDNCSFLDGVNATRGLVADNNGAGDGAPSVYGTNLLIVNNAGAPVTISGQAAWFLDHLLVFGNGAAASPPLTDAHYGRVLTANPVLGTCKVFIPAGSPAKGAGVGGADIGANVLYRYQDGVLTNTPLWDPTTGRFPCGAQVAGVNDIAGSSCFDVHKRLNVNTNGCTLPTSVSSQPTSVLPQPANLHILGSQP